MKNKIVVKIDGNKFTEIVVNDEYVNTYRELLNSGYSKDELFKDNIKILRNLLNIDSIHIIDMEVIIEKDEIVENITETNKLSKNSIDVLLKNDTLCEDEINKLLDERLLM